MSDGKIAICKEEVRKESWKSAIIFFSAVGERMDHLPVCTFGVEFFAQIFWLVIRNIQANSWSLGITASVFVLSFSKWFLRL